MGDITENLSRHEFACRCRCGLADPHPVLVFRIQEIRSRAGRRLDVNSGSRCQQHNHREGGRAFSQHLPQTNGYTNAADWKIPGLDLVEMYSLVVAVPEFMAGGIGLYLSGNKIWVHTDCRRGGPVRWGSFDGVRVSMETVLKAAEGVVSE